MANITIEYDDGTEASVEMTDDQADALAAAIESVTGKRMNVKT